MFYDPSNIFVDVRSPAEYVRGHIPGAINIPLLSNEERAVVGTAYVQQGRQEAIEKGKRIVGVKFASFVESERQAFESSLNADRLFVYCWRGGMRSASMSWLFWLADLPAIAVTRGYKAYRQEAIEYLGRSRPYVVISGRTGSGKTRVLDVLRGRGHQVIDLEFIANHKGSAFGALNMPPQPSSEHAMNLLHRELSMLNPNDVVFIEDESLKIGSVALNEGFFRNLQTAPRIVIDVARKQRATALAHDYGQAELSDVAACFQKIGKKLGGARLAIALDALSKQDYAGAAEQALDYYDRTYDYNLSQSSATIMARISSSDGDPEMLADRVLKLVGKK